MDKPQGSTTVNTDIITSSPVPDEFTTPDEVKLETEQDSSRGAGYDRLSHISAWRQGVVVICSLVGIMLSIMDTSIVSTSVYTISLHFNSLAKTIWTILAYTLADLGFAIIFARLRDHIGRRTAMLSAFVIFTAFSLACGFAQTINQLIAFRTVQGIGGSGLYALGIIVVVESAPLKMMPFIAAMVGAAVAVAGVLGPVLGGLLTHYVSWRWIFFINAPIAGTAIVLFSIAYPNEDDKSQARKSLKTSDIVGALLLLGAGILVVLGLQEGGTGASPWKSAIPIATITAGGVAWFLLLGWQWFIARKHPSLAGIFPLKCFFQRALTAGIFYTLLTGMIYLTLLFALPLRFQLVNHKDSAAAGVHMLPLLVAVAIGSFLTGAINARRNNIFCVFALASVFTILGTALSTTLGTGTAIEAKSYGFQVLLGLGVGMTFANISMMTSFMTSAANLAVAQGILAMARIFGGSIGIAASNALFNQQAQTELPAVLSSEQIRQLQQDTSVITTFGLRQAEAVALAYAHSFKKTMWMCLGCAGVVVVLAGLTWMNDPPDPRPAMRQRIVASQERVEREQEEQEMGHEA